MFETLDVDPGFKISAGAYKRMEAFSNWPLDEIFVTSR